MHDIEVSVFFMRDLRNQIGGDDASALIAFVCPGIRKGGGCPGFPEQAATTHSVVSLIAIRVWWTEVR